MALNITQTGPGGGQRYTHDGEPVYLNADRSAVVPGDSPEAAYLLVGTGGQLSMEEARTYGLVADDPPATEEKAAAAKANKVKSAPENK